MPESAIVSAVRASIERVPDRKAIIFGDHAVSYFELDCIANAAAVQIANKARGDIVGMLLPNIPEFAWTLLGALWAGKTVAVLPTLAPPALLGMMAAEAGFTTVLTNEEFAPRVAEAKLESLVVDPYLTVVSFPLQKRPGPAALLLYTSGTTGLPKAVALTDENILVNAQGCREAAGFGPDEVMLDILPLFHAYGLTVTLILPLILGGTIVLLERFAPRTMLQAIERHRITSLVAIPSQYRLLVKEPTQADTASLWLCIAGAERLPDQVAIGFEERFHLPIIQGYGATEASPVISMNPPKANRLGSVGRALPHVRITVREDGRELSAKQVGEICVEGPNVMLAYHNRPEATAEKLVSGVLRTGDQGYLDADGYLYLSGRADDQIKVAGEKIYPAEVEQALEQIEGVEEAAVIGVPDETHGAVLCAFVQPKTGATLTEAALRAGCRQRLEAYKVPRSFTVVEQIPRGPSGKLDKRALAATLRQPM